MTAPIDLTGKRYGKLLVIKRGFSKKRRSWICFCDCGKTKEVLTDNLRGGGSRSCGCVSARRITKLATTHGKSSHKMWGVWSEMKQRCSNPKSRVYRHYGGRGIAVCEEWENSFEAFYRDMGPSYKEGLEIDRIDNDKDYSPSNCRWATRSENMRNTRRNRVYKEKTIPEWAEATGIKGSVLAGRLRSGWTWEEALNIPTGGRRKRT